jgi:tight adherence protein B
MSAAAFFAATVVVAFGFLVGVAPRLLAPARRNNVRPSYSLLLHDPAVPQGPFHGLTARVRCRVASRGHIRDRDEREFGLELAHDLEHVARLVRSGRALGAALGDVAGERPASLLDSIAARRASGESLQEAITGVERARSDASSDVEVDADRRLAIAVLAAVVDAGGPGAAALDRAADTIRERDAIRAERRAHAAQARLSAQILSFLPLAFTGWTTMTDDRVARFLLASPLGAACLATGIALDLAGWRWMHRLVAAS